jgi:hypothetical protein
VTSNCTSDLCTYYNGVGVCAACAWTTAGWTRCKLENLAGSNGAWRVGNLSEFNGSIARAACRVALTWAQGESSNVATAYIPGSLAQYGTVARAADNLAPTRPAGMTATEGCARITVATPWTGTVPGAVNHGFLSLSANERMIYTGGGSTTVVSWTGGGSSASVAGGFVAGTAKAYRVTWSASANQLRLTNITDNVSGTAVAFTSWPTFGTSLYVGSLGGASSTPGIFSNLVIGATAGACL